MPRSNTDPSQTVQYLRGLTPRVLLTGGAPLLVYTLLHPHIRSDALVLAIGALIPVALTAATFIRRRRLNPVGVIFVLAFAAALIAALFGGDPLALKSGDAVVTGPFGLLCLASVAIGKPLQLVLLRRLSRRHPATRAVIDDPAFKRPATVVTALVGAMFLLHASVLLVLAPTQPTGTFLALSRPVGLGIIGAGASALVWYRNRRAKARTGVLSAEDVRLLLKFGPTDT